MIEQGDVDRGITKLLQTLTAEVARHGSKVMFFALTATKNERGVEEPPVSSPNQESNHPPKSVFANWNPIQPVNTHEAGSEGGIWRLIRDFDKGNSRVSVTATVNYQRLSQLRRPKKVIRRSGRRRLAPRTRLRIGIVTDSSISGDEVLKYLNKWWDNKTIKSWTSFGTLKFTVVAYSITASAQKLIEQHPLRPEVKFCMHVKTLDEANIDAQRRERIRELASKYADRGLSAFGYSKQFSLDIWEIGTPNTVPAIVWQSRGPLGEAWKPLVVNRRISESLTRSTEEINNYDIISKILSSLDSGAPISTISYYTGISEDKIMEVIEVCKNNSWLSSNAEITEKGAKYLSLCKKLAILKGEHKYFDATPAMCYAPSQLRGPSRDR